MEIPSSSPTYTPLKDKKFAQFPQSALLCQVLFPEDDTIDSSPEKKPRNEPTQSTPQNASTAIAETQEFLTAPESPGEELQSYLERMGSPVERRPASSRPASPRPASMSDLPETLSSQPPSPRVPILMNSQTHTHPLMTHSSQMHSSQMQSLQPHSLQIHSSPSRHSSPTHSSPAYPTIYPLHSQSPPHVDLSEETICSDDDSSSFHDDTTLTQIDPQKDTQNYFDELVTESLLESLPLPPAKRAKLMDNMRP